MTPRRWYAAWHPAVDTAIIRAKDASGLEDWRSRSWRAFPGPPIILDVTHALAGLLAALAYPPPDGWRWWRRRLPRRDGADD